MLQNTAKHLKDLVLSYILDEVLKNETIRSLKDEKVILKKLYINSVHIHGFKDDVLQTKEAINRLIIERCEEATKKLKNIIKTPAINVQWEYDSNSTWLPLNPYINSQLEEGYRKNEKIVNI